MSDLWTRIKRNPVAYLTALGLGLSAMVAELGDLAPGWMMTAYTVVMATVAFVARMKVTPLSDPHDAEGRILVPDDH
jgi:uncharacterized membrane protein